MVAHTCTTPVSECCEVSTKTKTKMRAPVATAAAPLRRSNRAKNGSDKGRRRRTTTSQHCVEVRRKMEALRSLVPGAGREEAVDQDYSNRRRRLDAEELLFLAAADYIARLQVQVKVMQLMVVALEHTKD
ncbi:hypothetical protein GUJ93_ZPchr0005g14933 [Zizania palustris]|uniref:BHLH domain-containing protein n=1 Tax=Zizania palustris TaxID=103762 RepID=A0A8J5VQG1_ZIZPA|nr:hypothetical protein GUJ93_ZPchr0005g14933 [Zizania palustris]